MQTPTPPTNPEPLVSSALAEGLPRFLSHSLGYSLHIGLRSPADFLRHFPPFDLARSMATNRELLALLLERATGMRRALAIHKSLVSAASDLQLSLQHGETEPATIVEFVDPDLIVEHLPTWRVWRYLTEDKFWLMDAGQAEGFELSRRFMSFILMTALSESLVTPSELVERISAERLARHLPRHALVPLLTRAFSGEEQTRLDGDAVLALAPPSILAECIPLAHLWRTIFVDIVSNAHELVPPHDDSNDDSTARHTKVERPRSRSTAAPAPGLEPADDEIDGVIEKLSSLADLPDVPVLPAADDPRRPTPGLPPRPSDAPLRLDLLGPHGPDEAVVPKVHQRHDDGERP